MHAEKGTGTKEQFNMGATNPLYTSAATAEPASYERVVDIDELAQSIAQPNLLKADAGKASQSSDDADGARDVQSSGASRSNVAATDSSSGRDVTRQLAAMAQAAANFRAMTANRQRNE